MLAVQKYLATGKSLEDLNAEYGIKIAQHPELPLAILNYCQINSPKTHPIVRECRGLTLRTDTWGIAAKSFSRFFNWGELVEEMDKFNFSNFSVTEKVDGSLCLIYNHDGKWMANTRGSFGLDELNSMGFTWNEAFLKALGVKNLQELDNHLLPNITYVCEFCSPWNKVVRHYSEPKMYLLAAYRNGQEVDLESDWFSNVFHRPEVYQFHSIKQIEDYLIERAKTDATFEGVVIKDDQGYRWKIKNATYVALHRLKGEGQNMFMPKYLIPFVISGESDELLVYFKEVEERFKQVEKVILDEVANACYLYDTYGGLETQKEFALAILGKSKLQQILFAARRDNSHPSLIWRDHSPLLEKLFRS